MLQDGRWGDKCGQEETRSEGGLSGAGDGWALCKEGLVSERGRYAGDGWDSCCHCRAPGPIFLEERWAWIALAKARVDT